MMLKPWTKLESLKELNYISVKPCLPNWADVFSTGVSSIKPFFQGILQGGKTRIRDRKIKRLVARQIIRQERMK